MLSGAAAADQDARPAASVVLLDDVKWEPLNPARGDQSPQAGTLWGDRNGTTATGFLLKPVDGFRSPEHIHNVSYRGVLISGLIHNDDPGAADMWMPAGSFWTQPKGEVHITAARGADTLAYIEIESGPYLVHPADEAFDSGERPINVDASNLVWIGSPRTSSPEDVARVAYLWGNPRGGYLNGRLVEIPTGYVGNSPGHSATLRVVVIQGTIRLMTDAATGADMLGPGSFLMLEVGLAPHLACETGSNCIVYVRTEGDFEFRAVKN